MGQRIVEAYIGEYASGKSEVAINRAMNLADAGREVVLVDLDIVEPFYTLRPIKKQLEQKGITVLAWETGDTMGLGETGNILRAENRWALRRSGDIILDVGYGVEGAKTLKLLEDASTDPDLKVYAVINIARPMTSNIDEIVQYIKELGLVHGLVNNSHLGDATDIDIIQQGAAMVSQAAKELGLPVVATTVVIDLASAVGTADQCGNPVRALVRYMPHAFW